MLPVAIERPRRTSAPPSWRRPDARPATSSPRAQKLSDELREKGVADTQAEIERLRERALADIDAERICAPSPTSAARSPTWRCWRPARSSARP